MNYMKIPPPEMQNIELTQLSRWPEFTRPLQIDSSFDPNSLIQARAHIGILNYHRGDYELYDYTRSEWRIVRKKLRELVQINASGSNASVASFIDDTNTSREIYRTDFATNKSTTSYNIKYGSGTTAATNTDYNIQTQLGQTIVVSGITYDDASSPPKLTAQGSRVHTESNATINEVSAFQYWDDNTNSPKRFLIDRTIITATLITTNQSISITYEWTF